jgi:hypothetical protein
LLLIDSSAFSRLTIELAEGKVGRSFRCRRFVYKSVTNSSSRPSLNRHIAKQVETRQVEKGRIDMPAVAGDPLEKPGIAAVTRRSLNIQASPGLVHGFTGVGGMTPSE